MARPTCPKCDNARFQVSEIEPMNSNFKLMATHCTSCGAVVGVSDYYNIGTLIHKLAKALRVEL
jgi:hypothetical protein